MADVLAGDQIPPIDIERLVSEYADVVPVSMPDSLDVDAVLLGLDDRLPRPRVLLNSQKPERRKRFTLAHELAHILLPWHAGTIACSTDPNYPDTQWASLLESEANRFAARLLVPQNWLLDEVCPSDSGAELVGFLESVQLSALPALLRVAPELPAGWLLALLDSRDRIEQSWRSQNSFMPHQIAGNNLHEVDLRADDAGNASLSGRTVAWWHWRPVLPPWPELPPLSPSIRRPPDIARRDQLRDLATSRLREALEASGSSEDELPRFAGLTGNIHGITPLKSATSLYSSFRQRLSSESELGAVIHHPAFLEYLAARAWQWCDHALPG